MKAIALFSMFLATTAAAQPVVGPEVSVPPIELGDSAIAPLRDGLVAAWSDADRIHVAHVLLHGPVLINNTNLAPAIVVKDGKYDVSSGDQLLVLNDRLDATAGNSGDLPTVTMTPKTTCSSGWFATCSLVETFTFRSPSFSRAFPLAANYYDPSYSPLRHDPIILPYRYDTTPQLSVLAARAINVQPPRRRGIR